jgi:CO/xanthine dehydrogenase FAD-binding subunit
MRKVFVPALLLLGAVVHERGHGRELSPGAYFTREFEAHAAARRVVVVK